MNLALWIQVIIFCNYDSTHGKLPLLNFTKTKGLKYNNKKYYFLFRKRSQQSYLGVNLKIDVVLECSGVLHQKKNLKHI